MHDSANIARHLPLMAARQPERAAVKVPRGRTADGRIDYLVLSFAELDTEVDAWMAKLSARGVQRGDRVLVMVRQGLPLIAAAFALFKLGAVPVIIDPGMGRKSFLACVTRSKPRVLLGLLLAQVMSHVFRSAFKSVVLRVWVSGSATARLSSGPQLSAPHLQSVASSASDLAAILFTSGSTGAPKGVCYEHGMFEAQVQLIRDTYNIQPGEIDLPMLPIFALFNPALGMTTIVPEIDPSRPAEVDPAKIVQSILQENVTNSFGSPTLWSKIGDHCIARKITLPSLRRVLCAGAPVPASLWKNSSAFLPNGRLHSPYGATEALPVATISAHDVDPASVRGACVGRPVSGVAVKIIYRTNENITALSQVRELPIGDIGEIIVCGPNVTLTYDGLPEATAAAKIRDDDRLWHRMGDCGYLDPAGRIWFCGRKVERVETEDGPLFTEPCEQVFRTHPRVTRCALIGRGGYADIPTVILKIPALVVEGSPTDSADRLAFARELRALAIMHPHTAQIRRFYFHPKFPVDVRHNAKIHRLALAQWATTALAYEEFPSS